jgi:hypothetical protein
MKPTKRAVTNDGPGEVGITGQSKSPLSPRSYIKSQRGSTMLQPTISRFVKSVEYKSLTVLLSDFRKTLERENGRSIDQLQTSGAEMLSDLCIFLGLSDENRRKVLGKDGARFIDSILDTPIRLPIKH